MDAKHHLMLVVHYTTLPQGPLRRVISVLSTRLISNTFFLYTLRFVNGTRFALFAFLSNFAPPRIFAIYLCLGRRRLNYSISSRKIAPDFFARPKWRCDR